ncbi:MAG: hypothetical protein IPP94_03515 [Ignavibacteria bacterium]|nr:hypothetical protein [Ignavibacteria bacterium]
MTDRLTIAHIDERVAAAVFERNIRNSQHVVSGDFESALEDIIVQLEQPPVANGKDVQVADLTKRIARALRSGFAGLPPNGFEFCAWLWDVAPLHMVQIPHANEFGAARGFQFGVIHLRKIAAMVLDLYIDQQPQKLRSLVPMLDSSVDWVDARNLIQYTFLDYTCAHFEQEYAALLADAHEKKVWRKLFPLGAAARIVTLDASFTAMALALLPPTFEAAGDANVYAGITFALRAAAMYGDQHAFGVFLGSQRDQTHPEIRRVFGETIRRPRIRWSFAFSEIARPVLDSWLATSPPDVLPVLAAARSKLAGGR